MRVFHLALALGAAAAVTASVAPPATADTGASTVTVCSSCTVRTVQEGLTRLATGGTLRVEAGHYAGPVVVTRSAHLVGVGNPVLDGGEKGTVVRISASDSSISGFVVRGSGENPDTEDTGISVRAPRVSVLNNRLEDVLFGIYAKAADGSRIAGNTVGGKDDLSLGEKGDGIRVFNSPNTSVIDNTTSGVRDNLMWFSDHCTVSGNHMTDSRYGIHFMWSDGCTVSDNVSTGNTVGGYFMYSVGLSLTDNVFSDNRASTGMGIGIRDTDNVIGDDNVVVGNLTGLDLFNSPTSINVVNHYSGNVIAYNDVGVSVETAGRGNVFSGNDFIDNTEQAATDAEHSASDITWMDHGRGNYWSDYSGYDANGDGVGDVSYAPHQTYESLVRADPDFALLYLSPTAQAIDWASNAFPILNSSIPVTDPAPLTHPVAAPIPQNTGGVAWPLLLGAGLLLILGLGVIARVRWPLRPTRRFRLAPQGGSLMTTIRWRLRPARRRDHEGQATAPQSVSPTAQRSVTPTAPPSAQPVVVRGLGKKYGNAVIFSDLSFEVRPGEVVALWGDNGAGKTTVLRCLLGLVRHEGEISIGGWSTRGDSRRARAELGHVSQEPAFHGELTVAQTLAFYGRLRGSGRAAQLRALKDVGLGDDVAAKKVAALSGGMRRKLAIAVALLGEPRVLLLDEPTANLDQRSRHDLISLLGNLKRTGISMLLASHHPDEVAALADRVLRLKAGGPAVEVDLAAFDREMAASGQQVSVTVPERRRDDAIRALLDAGIPLRHTTDCPADGLSSHSPDDIVDGLGRTEDGEEA